METQVYIGEIPTSWTDLDLSSVVGSKTSLVLIKYNGTKNITFRPDGSTEEWVQGNTGLSSSTAVIGYGSPALGLILTASNGIVEWEAYQSGTGTLSVVFYLNQ